MMKARKYSDLLAYLPGVVTATVFSWYALAFAAGHDEFVLSYWAWCVREGALPYVDFKDCYAPLSPMLDSAWMSLFGESILSLRLGMAAVYVCLTGLVTYAAKHFVRPWAAALAGLCAACLTYPVFPYPLPSYYCQFFAFVAALLFVAYRRDEKRPFLFLAGCAAGVTFLFKQNAGVFATWALLVAVASCPTRRPGGSESGSGAVPKYLAGLLIALIAAASLALVRRNLSPLNSIVFVALPLVWGLSILWKGEVNGRLIRRWILILAGAAVPIMLVAVPYLGRGETVNFFRGLFNPSPRVALLTYTEITPPDVFMAAGLVALGAAYLLKTRWRAKRIFIGLMLFLAAVFLAVWVCKKGPGTAIWEFRQYLYVSLLLLGALVMLRGAVAEDDRFPVVLWGSFAVYFSLINYPYGVGYSHYFAAFTILFFTAVLKPFANGRWAQRFVAALPLLFLTFAGVLTLYFSAKAMKTHQGGAAHQRLGVPLDERTHKAVAAAAAVVPPEATVLSLHRGNTAFLFYFLRRNVPAVAETRVLFMNDAQFEKLIGCIEAQRAHFVLLDPKQRKQIGVFAGGRIVAALEQWYSLKAATERLEIYVPKPVTPPQP